MADQDTDKPLDDDGVEIIDYLSTVLVVLPPEGFDEQVMRCARSSLAVLHIATRSVSSEFDEMVSGRLQDEFLVEGVLADESMEGYSGLVIVGGEGAKTLWTDADAIRLAKEAAAQGKMIGAWGDAVGVLASAGVVSGVKVTGSSDCHVALKKAGAKLSTRQVVSSGMIVTGLDGTVGMRFGKALAQVVTV
ncbi:MAG: DJ-1/PfpI family protein [Planctomycetes bacterium]|nr:DJ-1/PfpI family protein [Planctomycetota bacterium]